MVTDQDQLPARRTQGFWQTHTPDKAQFGAEPEFRQATAVRAR